MRTRSTRAPRRFATASAPPRRKSTAARLASSRVPRRKWAPPTSATWARRSWTTAVSPRTGTRTTRTHGRGSATSTPRRRSAAKDRCGPCARTAAATRARSRVSRPPSPSPGGLGSERARSIRYDYEFHFNAKRCLLQPRVFESITTYATILELFAMSESTTRSMFEMVSSVALYMVLGAPSSYTMRQPAPWSRIPSNFPSNIICESFVSTSERGRSISFATCAISTVLNGSITRSRFCSISESCSAPRCAAMIGSSPSCAS
mmetsp:Transcript_9157/g.41668  ORF Transcript_9157/g.41668 Transcript_9157/m.41668 type:complete len:262 (+) Transcript_9157:1936-2721(+)